MREQVVCARFDVFVDIEKQTGTFEHPMFKSLWAGDLIFEPCETFFHVALGSTIPLRLKRFTGVTMLPQSVLDALRVHGFSVDWTFYATDEVKAWLNHA